MSWDLVMFRHLIYREPGSCKPSFGACDGFPPRIRSDFDERLIWELHTTTSSIVLRRRN